MFPVLVTRSIERIDNNKLSTVFAARFQDGTEKMIRRVSKNTGIIKPCEIGPENVTVLPKSECPLYFRNWSTNPVFGEFKKHYPK